MIYKSNADSALLTRQDIHIKIIIDFYKGKQTLTGETSHNGNEGVFET